ncbi:MAG: PKD domain containing protein, partial [Nocardioidaceae bacterium]|nr:PKD domain containing protein [Nocardioidaceae bacterium]
ESRGVVALPRSLLAATAVAALTLSAVPVFAAEPTLDHIVSANPENWTPNVNDGKVEGMVQVGNRIIAVGTFTNVTAGGTTYPRNSIVAFNATTGAMDTTFVPDVGTKEVNDIVDAGDGTVFVGGLISSVNGTGRSKVARIDATTGALVTAFKPPSINGQVTDMQLVNGRLYIGGAFTTVGGVPRTLLAALDPATGADTGTVAFTFAQTWNGGKLGVKHFDISDDGHTLVAVGNWRTVNGQARTQIMRADLTGATATLSGWATTRFTSICSSRFDTYLRDVDIDPTGTYFVVVTTGAYSGGIGSGTLCDAASRWELAPTTSGQNPTWVDYSGGDTFTQVKVTGPVIYVGGHFRWLNNPYASDALGRGGVARTGLAAIDPRNGLPFSWNPTRARGVGVWEFMTTNAGLWVGHDTNTTGKETRKRIALFPSAGGTALPAENTGGLPGSVYLLSNTTDDSVTRRAFTGSSVTSSTSVANGGETWRNARGAVMIDGTLFTGWSNGTLRARTFDGTTYGASTTVNLNGLTDFASELPSVTGMTYDRASGRLYYTLSGQSSLFYRHFLPEDRLVGATRFTAMGNTNGISWNTASGLMLVGSTLYVGSSTTGNLAAVGWNNGTLTGTATTVSGPGIDGNSWRTRGSFVYAA